jgi:hypothetical protein
MLDPLLENRPALARVLGLLCFLARGEEDDDDDDDAS